MKKCRLYFLEIGQIMKTFVIIRAPCVVNALRYSSSDIAGVEPLTFQ
jgi:hypothetical protein